MDLLRELLETIGDEMKPMVNDLFEICVDGLSDMSTGVQRAAVKLTVSAITVRLPHKCDVHRGSVSRVCYCARKLFLLYFYMSQSFGTNRPTPAICSHFSVNLLSASLVLVRVYNLPGLVLNCFLPQRFQGPEDLSEFQSPAHAIIVIIIRDSSLHHA